MGPGQSLAAATPSRAQALAFARAVNLRAGDLPGFKAGAVSKTTASERKMSAQLASCSGGVNPSRALIERDSPDLTAASGIVQADVSSEVEVLPSAALVAKDLAAVKSARGKACLERALNKEFAAMKVKGVKFGRVTVTTTQLPAVGASGSFALRFTISATIRGAKIPYYADFLGFTLGPAEVTSVRARLRPAGARQGRARPVLRATPPGAGGRGLRRPCALLETQQDRPAPARQSAGLIRPVSYA